MACELMDHYKRDRQPERAGLPVVFRKIAGNCRFDQIPILWDIPRMPAILAVTP